MKLLLAFLLLDTSGKFEQIQKEKLRPGSRVVLTVRELNVWANSTAPKGVRNVHLEGAAPDRATGTAMVNFAELNHGHSNWIFETLLAGERPLKVAVRIQTANGKIRVDVERADYGGVTIEGRMLEFLIQLFVVPSFPEAQVGQWVPLAHHMDHFEITPQTVTVVIAK